MNGSHFLGAILASPHRLIFPFLRRAFACLSLAFLAPLAPAAGSWEWASPTPTGNHMNSFAYGAGRFVGVGVSGEIVTSPDGVTWTVRNSGITDSLFRVVFDGARFVAVSANHVLTSPDGVIWTKQPGPTGLRDLAFGNNRFVAIAQSTGTDAYRFETSTDGVAWTSTPTLSQLLRVHFANGVFLAVDNSGRALSSTDGLAWTTTQLPDASGISFFSAAGNGRFLLSNGDKTFVSTDGVTWRGVTSHPPAAPASSYTLTVPYLDAGAGGSSIGFAGGFFFIQQSRYAADPYRVYRSVDGETWEPATVFDRADLGTLADGSGTWVGSERTTLYYGVNRSNYAIYSSNDGLVWTARSGASIDSYANLVYGVGRFFVGGKVSSDAVTWVANPFAATHAAGDRVFRITSKYEFSSSSSTIIDPKAITSVEASADGLTGTLVDVKMPTPRSIAFGAGRYVAVGDGGKVSSSTDGFTWTAGSSGVTGDLAAVTFAFDRFVAVGTAGTMLTSPDGIAWTTQSSGTNLDLVSLAAGPDRIVVGTLGSSSAVPGFNLPGGVPVQIVATRRSDSLAWFDGEFTSLEYNLLKWPLAAGSFSLAKSTDGVTWTDESTRVPWGPNGVGRLAVGNNVELLLAPAGLDWGTSPLFSALIQKRKAGAAAPVITYPPAATTVHQGETAQFSVGATGSGIFSYQWYHDGAPIAGATSQVLTLPLAKEADAGNYTVTVTNAYGSATSAAGRLTIETAVPLTITKQPVGGTVYELQSFYLTVEVTGSGPITYQWRRNGQPLGTAMSNTYEIWAPVSVLDNFIGDYDVVITSPTSTVTSQVAKVTRAGPTVTVTKSGGSGVGATLVLTANATGKGPFTYKWGRAGGLTFGGATSATLVLPNVIGADTSPYNVSVTDADGYPGQAFVTVAGPDVNPLPTQFRATTEPGQKLTLRAPVSIGDRDNATYQWRFNGNPIAGATNWNFTTPEISGATAGDYAVVVTIGADAVTYTTTVSLGTAGPSTPPTFAAQTTGRTVLTGGGTTFAVSVDGSVSSYQWQVSTNGGSTWTNVTDGNGYSGATTAILSIANATAAMNNYQYRCVASNGTTTVTSAAATLAITNDPPLVYPVSVARDAAGNLFVADASANVIRKVTPSGAVSVFAGTVGSAGAQDGNGAAARFNQPGGLAFDPSGNLYVADTGNGLIRRITPAGTVSTLAGDASLRGNVDGSGSGARFNHPTAIALDGAGNAYVCDTFTHTVRKVTAAGTVTTLAGANAVTGSTDGTGAAARFNNPAGVAVAADGTIYVADTNNHTIRKITSSGVVTTLAGLAGVIGADDGTGNNALFNQPASLVVDASGNLYVADTGNALIRRVTPAGAVTLVAGVPGIAGFADGVGLDAMFDQPRGLALDGTNLLVADTGNAALRKINANAAVTTLSLSIAPVSNPPPTTPEPPPSQPATGGGTSGGSRSGGGGGGGAPSTWFLGALALLWVLRQRKES